MFYLFQFGKNDFFHSYLCPKCGSGRWALYMEINDKEVTLFCDNCDYRYSEIIA